MKRSKQDATQAMDQRKPNINNWKFNCTEPEIKLTFCAAALASAPTPRASRLGIHTARGTAKPPGHSGAPSSSVQTSSTRNQDSPHSHPSTATHRSPWTTISGTPPSATANRTPSLSSNPCIPGYHISSTYSRSRAQLSR